MCNTSISETTYKSNKKAWNVQHKHIGEYVFAHWSAKHSNYKSACVAFIMRTAALMAEHSLVHAAHLVHAGQLHFVGHGCLFFKHHGLHARAVFVNTAMSSNMWSDVDMFCRLHRRLNASRYRQRPHPVGNLWHKRKFPKNWRIFLSPNENRELLRFNQWEPIEI